MLSEKATTATIEDAGKTPARKALPAHRLRYDALLVFITMIWGSTFLVVKNTVGLSGPFTYLAFAYGVGALTLALIFRKRLARITRAEVRNGSIIGLFLFAGYALQTTGLQFTTVSAAVHRRRKSRFDLRARAGMGGSRRSPAGRRRVEHTRLDRLRLHPRRDDRRKDGE